MLQSTWKMSLLKCLSLLAHSEFLMRIFRISFKTQTNLKCKRHDASIIRFAEVVQIFQYLQINWHTRWNDVIWKPRNSLRNTNAQGTLFSVSIDILRKRWIQYSYLASVRLSLKPQIVGLFEFWALVFMYAECRLKNRQNVREIGGAALIWNPCIYELILTFHLSQNRN